jgi:hypothetical protein
MPTFPLQVAFTHGATVYAVSVAPDGRWWNTDLQAFEDFDPDNWADYAQPLAEVGATGIFRGDYPTGIVNTLTTEYYFSQAGGSPAMAADAPAIADGASQGVSLAQILGDSAVVKNLQAALSIEEIFTVQDGVLSAITCPTDLSNPTPGAYNNRTMYFISGGLIKQGARITSYNPVNGVLVFTACTGAPSVGDKAIIV